MNAQVAPEALDRIIHQIAVAAVQLQRAVGDARAGVGRKALGHGGKAGLVRGIVADLGRREIKQGARRFQFGRHVGQHELGILEVGDCGPELLAFARIGDRLVEAALSAAQAAGADIEPPAVEAHHGDPKALALAPDAVLDGHANIVEIDLARRLAVPAQLSFLRTEAHSGHVLLDHQGADALGAFLASTDHGHVNFVLAPARDKGLGARDDIMVAVPGRPRLQRSRVRTARRFGQAIAAQPFHPDHARQILLLDRVRPEAVDHPGGHVVDGNEGAGRRTAIAHRLEDQRRFEPPEPDPAAFLGNVDSPKAKLGRLDDRVAREVMPFIPLRGVRSDLGGGELARHILDLALVVGKVELGHGPSPSLATGDFPARRR